MKTPVSRRRVLTFSGLGVLAAGILGCAHAMSRPLAALPAPAPSSAPVTAQIGRRMRLHMFQTGWVSVKKEHRAFSGPASLRFPAIMASQSWTEWMPVTAYAVEHPEGLIVIDTGEAARILQADYTACDSGTGLFYRRNLQFALDTESEIGAQMFRAGLEPNRVTKVVMTHLHSDHIGGMAAFPEAEFLISEQARFGHAGALMCRIPSSLNIRGVQMTQNQGGVFPRSHNVTTDGAIKIVPTPGHAKGHQSVLIEHEGLSLCLVGDAVFNLEQIQSGEIGGIVENVADARTSAALLRRQRDAFGTVMLPTHDPENAGRLRHLQH